MHRLERAGLRAAALQGFAAEAEGAAVVEGDAGVIVRGRSDRAWTYALADGPGGAEALAPHLVDDRALAGVADPLADALVALWDVAGERSAVRTRAVTLGWTERALPPITVPAGYRQRALHARDAAVVDAAWARRGTGTDALIERLIARGPTVATETDAGELVGWALALDDRSLGAGFVAEAHRGRGIFGAQVARLVSTVRARDWAVVMHVGPEWAALWAGRGWSTVAEISSLVRG